MVISKSHIRIFQIVDNIIISCYIYVQIKGLDSCIIEFPCAVLERNVCERNLELVHSRLQIQTSPSIFMNINSYVSLLNPGMSPGFRSDTHDSQTKHLRWSNVDIIRSIACIHTLCYIYIIDSSCRSQQSNIHDEH